MTHPKLHLASASPRRRKLLNTLGLTFTHAGEDLDERRLQGEAADAMVIRLSCDKARAAARERPGRVVLGADTAVVLGERIFGKPQSREDALTMLLALSGNTHEVVTGVAVLRRGELQTALNVSRVRFRNISAAEAEAYWICGEPQDKAGGYAIQGRGAVFVAELCGSCSGVIGLPLCDTAQMLENAGIAVLMKPTQGMPV